MKEMKVPLSVLAHARSGDKASSSNIGLIAYTKLGYDFLEKNVTAEKVAAFFKALNPVRIQRYELPNLLAFNFVLEGILEGGGSRSLRIDAQGKALGQALLEMPIVLPIELYKEIAKFQRIR